MMSVKEKIIGLTGVLLFLSIWYIIDRNNKRKKNTIEQNKYSTVCKVFRVDSRRSFTHANYYFYYKDSMYISWKSVDKFEYEILDKYFKVELSTDDPDYSEILFDQEVTDPKKIVNAGFKYESPKENK